MKKHLEEINNYIEDMDLRTILDYGSGKGKFHSRISAKVTPYDPAYEPFSKEPVEEFDGVICTDVMEHIPEEEVEETLDKIFNFARYFVYFSISTKEAKKILPNGENAHCTVKPKEWWEEEITKHQTSQVVIIKFD